MEAFEFQTALVRAAPDCVLLSDNALSGDVVDLVYSAASFADKNVGLLKTVNVRGIGVSGANAGDYTIDSAATATAPPASGYTR